MKKNCMCTVQKNHVNVLISSLEKNSVKKITEPIPFPLYQSKSVTPSSSIQNDQNSAPIQENPDDLGDIWKTYEDNDDTPYMIKKRKRLEGWKSMQEQALRGNKNLLRVKLL